MDYTGSIVNRQINAFSNLFKNESVKIAHYNYLNH